MTANETPSPVPLHAASREDVERLCIENLLTAAEERVFFKDLDGRYIMVSTGWLMAEAPGRSLAEVIGHTDFELFSPEYATSSREDEQHVIATGNAVVGKVARQAHDGRRAWVSTTRVPLRSRDGSVIGTFGTTRDVTADIEAHDALTYRALHDPLTGLINRVGLIDRLSQALLSLERRPGWVGVLFIDLDDFKTINDTLGHEAGDAVLVEAGRRLTAAARRTDTVARLGGDELILLCSELRERSCVSLVADRAVAALRTPLPGAAAAMPCSASVGAACTSDPATTPAELLHRADLAMYAAKRAGGDRHVVFDAAVHGPASRSGPTPGPAPVASGTQRPTPRSPGSEPGLRSGVA